jgi:hypothetical protein
MPTGLIRMVRYTSKNPATDHRQLHQCSRSALSPKNSSAFDHALAATMSPVARPTRSAALKCRSTPIKRHVKVQGDANPYDPAYELYFEQREGTHMQETFRGTRTLRFLWHEQRGLCTVCNTQITRITGWRLHHCVPRVMGGSQSAENRVLLHPECHDRVHRQRIPVSKPRLPERGVRRA